MNLNILQLALFICVGLMGIYSHWFKKVKRGEVHGNFLGYILADYPGKSMTTFATFIGLAFTAATAGALDNLNITVAIDLLKQGQLHVPTVSVLISGFMLGWTLDSGINQGSPQ